MYLVTHPLLTEGRILETDSDGMMNLLISKYGCEPESAKFEYSFLFFCYMVPYVSIEELSSLMGYMVKSNSIRPLIQKMINTGLVKLSKFKRQDGIAMGAYCLTNKGYEKIGGKLPGELVKQIKIRKQNALLMHDYSAGINYFHFFLSSLPFTWQREIVYGSSISKAKKNTLCVDAIVEIDNRSIYIEQDLGNEPIGTLLHKLDLYFKYRLMENMDDYIVYSIKEPYLCEKSLAYSKKYITLLLNTMEACKCNSLFGFYSTDLSMHIVSGLAISDRDKINLSECLYELLIITNVCNKHKKRIKSNDFSIEELKRYILELNTQNNPYRLISQNRRQFGKAQSIRNLFINTMIGFLCSGKTTDFYNQFLNGYSVYCVPTSLLSNYFPYMMPVSYGTIEKFYGSSAAYYSNLSLESYSSLSPYYKTRSAGLAFRLRNCLQFNGGNLCYEYISRDIGGWLRVHYAMLYMDTSQPVHIIAVVDTYNDAVILSKQVNYYVSIGKILYGRAFLSFLLSADLGKIGRLFTVSMMDNARVDLPIL